MVRYSVTGTTQGWSEEVYGLVHDVVKDIIGDASEFTTGGAPGVDTIAAFWAWKMGRGRVLLRGCFPAGQYYNTVCHKFVETVEMVPGGYMKRNDALVAHADHLLAFPKTSDEELRSGTWATVRRARKAGVDISTFALFTQAAA